MNIRDWGAKGDGVHKDTAAIQKTIDECSRQGGGRVLVPRGTFLTGALFLKPGTNLEIAEGGVLLGSRDLDDYPMTDTRFEGRTCRWPVALVNGSCLGGISLTGRGTIDGNAHPFWTQFWDERRRAVEAGLPFTNRDVPRPRLVYLDQCRDVRIEGLTLQNSGFWNLHLHDGENLVVEGVTIRAPHGPVRAPSSDAIDIDACCNVVIRACDFDTDDDCVCLKGGKGPEAHLINRPTENILVEDCHFGFGHGVITFGSEANHVRNVTVRRCVIDGENNTVRFKFRDDTVQCFENILFEDLTIRNSGWLFDVRPWVSRQDEVLAGGLPSVVRNLIVRRVRATNLKSPGILHAIPGTIDITGVVLEDLDLSPVAPGTDLDPSRFDALEQIDSPVAPDRLTVLGVEDLKVVRSSVRGRALVPEQE